MPNVIPLNPLQHQDNYHEHQVDLEKLGLVNTLWVQKEDRVFCCGEIKRYALTVFKGNTFERALFYVSCTPQQDKDLATIYTNPGHIQLAFVDPGLKNAFLLTDVSMIGVNITTRGSNVDVVLTIGKNNFPKASQFLSIPYRNMLTLIQGVPDDL